MTEAEPIREVRTGFLEKAVAQSAPNVQWASPLFIRSSYDNVIRRWWLWQAVCVDKQPQVLPSIELLAAAMIRHKTPEQAQENLNNALADFKPKNCTDTYLPQSKPSKPIIIAKDLVITEGMRGIRQRIMYNMPWLFERFWGGTWLCISAFKASILSVTTNKSIDHIRVILNTTV